MDNDPLAVVVETSAVTVVVEQTPELRVIEGVPGPVGPRGKMWSMTSTWT